MYGTSPYATTPLASFNSSVLRVVGTLRGSTICSGTAWLRHGTTHLDHCCRIRITGKLHIYDSGLRRRAYQPDCYGGIFREHNCYRGAGGDLVSLCFCYWNCPEPHSVCANRSGACNDCRGRSTIYGFGNTCCSCCFYDGQRTAICANAYHAACSDKHTSGIRNTRQCWRLRHKLMFPSLLCAE